MHKKLKIDKMNTLFNSKLIDKSILKIPEYMTPIIGIICLLVYYIPYFIYWDNMYIHIHDNLDSAVSYMKVLKDTNNLFNLDGIFPIMDGLDRSSFPNQTLYLLLNKYFPTYTAYFLNDLAGRLIGFTGMYLLLTRYVIKDEQYKTIISLAVSISFLFAGYIPTYGSFSVMGQPLLFYAFLNLKNKKKLLMSYLAITIVVLNSYIVFAGLFVGIFLFLYYTYIVFKEKKAHLYYLLGFTLLTSLFIIEELPLFLHFLTDQPESNRSDYQSLDISVGEIIYSGLRLLYRTHYHTVALPTFLILLLSIFVCFRFKKTDKKIIVLLYLLLSIIVFSILFRIMVLIFSDFKLIRMFQFDRFYFLLPIIYMLLLALSLKYIIKLNRGKLLFFLISLFFIGSVLYFNKEHRISTQRIVSNAINIPFNTDEPTFKQFYDEELFNEIERFLGDKKQYKIICLGLHPAVAFYNGFYTLDGYFPTYSLEYKHKFREIIAEELEKSEENRKYFDYWGNRCYLFSSELRGFLFEKNSNTKITNLSINIPALKNMGGKYIFSSVEIANHQSIGISFVKNFTSPESFWKIRVYQVL